MITVKKVVSAWYFFLYVSFIISVLGSLTLMLVAFTEKKIVISDEPHLDNKYTLFFLPEEKTCDIKEEIEYKIN